MASLHKDPHGRSPFWYVAYRRGDGIRTLKSTRERDLHRAQLVAHGMVRVAEEEFRKDTTKSLLNGIVADTLRRLGIETKPEPKVTEFLNQWENPELFGKLQALDWMADDEAEEREREDNNEPQPNRFTMATCNRKPPNLPSHSLP